MKRASYHWFSLTFVVLIVLFSSELLMKSWGGDVPEKDGLNNRSRTGEDIYDKELQSNLPNAPTPPDDSWTEDADDSWGGENGDVPTDNSQTGDVITNNDRKMWGLSLEVWLVIIAVITLIIAILVALFGQGWLKAWKDRKQKGVETPDPNKIPKGAKYLTIKIKVGDYVEYKWGWNDVNISVISTCNEEFNSPISTKVKDGAEISIKGGGVINGGNNTIKLNNNHFKIPVYEASFDAENDIFFYEIVKTNFRFFSLQLKHINPIDKEVTLDIFFFRNW